MELDVRKIAESKFNYWAGYVANLILIFALAFVGLGNFDPTIHSFSQGLMWVAAGLFLYTFTEYIFHRFLYHEWTSIFVKGHALHHEQPRGLLGLPWYLPYPLIIGAFFGLSYATGNPFAVGLVMSAWWMGFVLYW